jgi:hypothetical protein
MGGGMQFYFCFSSYNLLEDLLDTTFSMNRGVSVVVDGVKQLSDSLLESRLRAEERELLVNREACTQQSHDE